MMIPKIIHYCWFGKGEKDQLINKCINSWKKYCPDYEIIEWNEESFDINMNDFVREAYEMKKYAFVSDYARLYILYNYGGIYVDTDLEIRKNIDIFLKDRAFSSFETKDNIPTAIMGAEKEHPWIEKLLLYYSGRKFIKEDGSFDMLPNPKIITEITKNEYHLELNNKKQRLQNGLVIYPDYMLCTNYVNSKNYSIHHFNGSWINKMYKMEALKYKKNYTILVKMLRENHVNLKKISSKYRDIYIYGVGHITENFIKILEKQKIILKGLISNEEQETLFGYRNFQLPSISHIKADDLIIVTPSYDFNIICDELSLYTKAELMSIEYVLDVDVKYI
ncbi:MAG: glycosyltransferase [Bacilli bacterium]